MSVKDKNKYMYICSLYVIYIFPFQQGTLLGSARPPCLLPGLLRGGLGLIYLAVYQVGISYLPDSYINSSEYNVRIPICSIHLKIWKYWPEFRGVWFSNLKTVILKEKDDFSERNPYLFSARMWLCLTKNRMYRIFGCFMGDS